MKRSRRGLAALGLTALMLASACSSSDDADDRVNVVVTTTIIGDVVTNIVGDDANVEVLLPVGADPHSYQASSRQAASIQTADLVIANGLNLEEGLSDLLESAQADGANILELGPNLEPLPFTGPHDHEGEDHSEEEGNEEEGHDEEEMGLDPHIWLDPLRMADAANLIAAELTKVDPNVDWAARAGEYAAQLNEIDTRINQILDVLPDEQRKLVTNHGSLGYFADRYNFEVVGVVIPGGSTLADPSSAELTALVEEIEHEGVKAIFGETTESTALADAVAAELGSEVAVVELFTGSLGEPGSGAETLTDLLVTNARLIADALS